ncbi:MAG: protein-glutamate O-methyltransferase CheR [Cyanobacteria bacterium P01_H01_bin.74]
MLTLTENEFGLLRGLIENECGISLQIDKQYLIENRLTNLMIQSGCDNFGDFYQQATKNINAELRDKIVDAITTNETLWFRDQSPYDTLAKVLFPDFEKNSRSCKIWSAACSTGQEPYSIVMTAFENTTTSWAKSKLQLVGTDISSSALKLAESARYNKIAISRGLSEQYKTKYFDVDGAIYKLSSRVKDLVKFQKFNLQNSFTGLGQFDIIFLRNVAIYFAHDFKVELFKKIANALNPGGYLFIGSSESLIGYSDAFKTVQYERCRYYQLK